MSGWMLPGSRKVSYFAVSPIAAPFGAPALAKRSSGGLYVNAPRKPPLIRSLRTTCVVPVPGSATQPVENLSKFSSCWDTDPWRPRKGISAPGRGSCTPSTTCLLYTSDAADDLLCVDL